MNKIFKLLDFEDCTDLGCPVHFDKCESSLYYYLELKGFEKYHCQLWKMCEKEANGYRKVALVVKVE